jgi:hypothetical protein
MIDHVDGAHKAGILNVRGAAVNTMMKNIVLPLILIGCNSTHVARLDNGGGLGEGSRVVVSGVQVGAVTDVRVVEGHVDVVFEIDSDHEITFREDACALGFPEDGGGYLLVTPGTGAAREDDAEHPIPQCQIGSNGATDDTFRDLAQGMGELLEQLGRGIFTPPNGQGSGQGGTLPIPFPNLPMPAPRDESDACERVAVRADGVERMPEGYRAWIDFHNANTFAIRVGSVNDASFMDAEGRVLEPEMLPRGDTNVWFMPFDLPANASQRVAVVFRMEPSIATIEVRQSSPSDDPLSWCTIGNR